MIPIMSPPTRSGHPPRHRSPESRLNALEHEMLSLLVALRDGAGLVSVKAEFEAEGARMEEVWRLLDLGRRAGLGLTLKIGGCEARRDLHEARMLGVERVVAPMVETPYALDKYLGALRDVLGSDSGIACSVNIETAPAIAQLKTMLERPGAERLEGILIGRSDLAGSLGLPRSNLAHPAVTTLCHEAVRVARTRGLNVAIGGGMSPQAMPFIAGFGVGELDRVETRKLVFQAHALIDHGARVLEEALRFEILWLKTKQAHYRRLSEEDTDRLAMLDRRLERSERPEPTHHPERV